MVKKQAQCLQGISTMRKGKIYISAPISGYDTEERERYFEKQSAFLQMKGWKVFNPMKNGLPKDASYEQHMKADIKELLKCDAIFMCQGFGGSNGCMLEHEIAQAIGLRIYYEVKERTKR